MSQRAVAEGLQCWVRKYFCMWPGHTYEEANDAAFMRRERLAWFATLTAPLSEDTIIMLDSRYDRLRLRLFRAGI